MSLLLISVFFSFWIPIITFSIPAIESLVALISLNKLRSSRAFLFTAFALSIPTAAATSAAVNSPFQEPPAVVMMCCLNIVWGGFFQLRLDLVGPIKFSEIYGIMAACFITKLLWPVVWAWAYFMPLCLSIGMIVLSHKSADSAGGGGGAVAGDPEAGNELKGLHCIVKGWRFWICKAQSNPH